MNKIPLFLLMIVGEVLICMGATLLLGDVEPQNLLVLNVVALSMVYLLVFSSSFDLFNDINIENSSSSGLGLTLYGILFYSVLTIGCVVASYIWMWSLLVAIVAQVGALFVLFLFFILSNRAVNSVEEGMYRVECRKESLRYAKELLDRLDIQVKLDSSKPQRVNDVETIKEQLRYVTFSDRVAAQDLDNKLIEAIHTLLLLSNNSSSGDNMQWADTVGKCSTIIRLRKQQL